MPPGEVDVEVLDDADDAGGAGRGAVGRDGHEVDLDRQANGPGQVGHEHEGPLQHADEQRGRGVVGGDLVTQLGDPRLDLLLPTTTGPSEGSSR